MESWNDDELVEELDENGISLTTWEADFLESVKLTVEAGLELTTNQRAKLMAIIAERC